MGLITYKTLIYYSVKIIFPTVMETTGEGVL